MTEPLKNFMRPGIIAFMAYPEIMKGEGPIKERLTRLFNDEYFDCIEIAWIKDDAVRADVKKLADASGIILGYGASPRLLTTGLNINDLDPEKREEAVASMLEGIDEAYELGAKGFAFLSCKYDPEKLEEHYAALLDSVRRMCDYAAEKGDIKVLMEVFDYDVDKKSLIGPTPLAKRFAEDMADRGNFGLLVDLSHVPLMHETIDESIYPVRDYIRHVHIGNAVIDPTLPGYGDLHPRFGFPGSVNGEKELAEYLRALLAIGYLNRENPGIVSFEVKPFGDEDPEMVIANAKRTLDRAWAMV